MKPELKAPRNAAAARAGSRAGAGKLRLEALRRGRRAELLAVLWLRLKGYRILARGYRVQQGEVDLVAQRGGVLAMVEVKARANRRAAAEAISLRQQGRILRAALRFLQHHPHLAGLALRFDAVLITPRWLPLHLPDAWRPESRP